MTSVEQKAFSLHGVYPALVTPFVPGTEEVDYGNFEKFLVYLNKYPLAGFVCLGSTGEFPMLTPAEKVDIVKFVKTIVGKDRAVIAGAGAESTRETIDLVNKMAAVGADAVIVYNPCYFKPDMDPSAYIRHYTKVADASPVPVILYNVPGYTGIDLPIDAICKLAKHDNIVGIKDSTGDMNRIYKIIRLTSEVSKSFNIVIGSSAFFLGGLVSGCVGNVSALANIFPNELCQLQTLYEEGRLDEAKQLQYRLATANEAIPSYGIPGLKVAIKSLLGIDTGVVRSPLQPLEQDAAQKAIAIYSKAGFEN